MGLLGVFIRKVIRSHPHVSPKCGDIVRFRGNGEETPWLERILLVCGQTFGGADWVVVPEADVKWSGRLCPPLKASHPGSPLTRPQTRSPDNTGGCKKTTSNNRTSTRRCRSLLGTAAASDNQRKFESLTYVLWILKITMATTSSSRASLEFSLTCVPQQQRHNHHNWPGCAQII